MLYKSKQMSTPEVLYWKSLGLAGMGADNKLESCLYTLLLFERGVGRNLRAE